jgi:hypothetical protein
MRVVEGGRREGLLTIGCGGFAPPKNEDSKGARLKVQRETQIPGLSKLKDWVNN